MCSAAIAASSGRYWPRAGSITSPRMPSRIAWTPVAALGSDEFGAGPQRQEFGADGFDRALIGGAGEEPHPVAAVNQLAGDSEHGRNVAVVGTAANDD